MNIQIKTKTQNAYQSSLENNVSNQGASVVADINSAAKIGTLQASDMNVQTRSVEWLDLPNETYMHIFSYLSRKALSPLNKVCSAWNGVVQQIRTSGTLDFVKELPMSHENLIATIRKCSDLNNLYTSMSLYRFEDFTYEQTKDIINSIHSKGYASLAKILVSTEQQVAAFTKIQSTLYPEADAKKIKFTQDPRELHAEEIRVHIEDMCTQISIQIVGPQMMDLKPLTDHLIKLQEIIDRFSSSDSGLKLLSIVDPKAIVEILKFSIKANDLKLIKYFFENGVDLNIKKHSQVFGTLLHQAVGLQPECYPKNFMQELVDLLLYKGVDIEARDVNDRTALFNCLKDDQVALLIDRGANIEATDTKGKTALFESVIKISLEKTQVLLDRGANIEATDKMGNTPLLFAINMGFSRNKLVELLLEKGANIKAIDNEGADAFLLARKWGHLEIFNLILRKNPEAIYRLGGDDFLKAKKYLDTHK